MNKSLFAVAVLFAISLLMPQPALACGISHEGLAVIFAILISGLIYACSLLYFVAIGAFRIWKQTKQNMQAVRDGACIADAQQLLSAQKKKALRSVILYPLRNATIGSIVFFLTMMVWPH